MTPDFLVKNEVSLKGFDTQISEAVPDEKFEAEMTITLEYKERICNIWYRLCDYLAALTQITQGTTDFIPDQILNWKQQDTGANRACVRCFNVLLPLHCYRYPPPPVGLPAKSGLLNISTSPFTPTTLSDAFQLNYFPSYLND